MKLEFEQIRSSSHESLAVSVGCRRHFNGPYHFHPELELTYIEHGHGTRLVGSHLSHFESGNLALIGSNVPHYYANDLNDSRGHDWARSIVLQFHANCLGEAFFLMPETQSVAQLFTRAQCGLNIIGATKHTVVGKLKQVAQVSGYQRLMIFLEILGVLSQTPEEVQSLAQDQQSRRMTEYEAIRMDKAFRYLNTHSREVIYLKDVARIAGMTASSFSRFYKQMTGKSFQHTLIEIRLLDACQELMATDHSISEVCFATGFNNLSNFNRQFKRVKGISPKVFRAKWRHKQAASPDSSPL